MRNEEIKKWIGTNLTKIRTDRHLSRNDVAKRLNLSEQSIYNIENGNTDIGVIRLYQLSKVYNVHVSEIFAENSPISAKIESIRDEMKMYRDKCERYQSKLEKSQEKVIELQGKLTNTERNTKYQQ